MIRFSCSYNNRKQKELPLNGQQKKKENNYRRAKTRSLKFNSNTVPTANMYSARVCMYVERGWGGGGGWGGWGWRLGLGERICIKKYTNNYKMGMTQSRWLNGVLSLELKKKKKNKKKKQNKTKTTKKQNYKLDYDGSDHRQQCSASTVYYGLWKDLSFGLSHHRAVEESSNSVNKK